MNTSITEKRYKNILYSIFLFVFIIVIIRPIEISPDSEGYLSTSIIRLPIYPLFLTIIRAISFNYFDLATIFFQIILSIFSINFLIKNIKNSTKMNSIWLLLLTIIMLLPCIYNQNISNKFLSEAIAYPLYLLVVSNFIVSFIKEERKYLLYSYPILIVLLLTRSQFIFLIPVAILVLLWYSIKNKSLKKNAWLFILYLILPLITISVDKLYHGLVHDHFVSTPWTGIHLITPAFYVADKEDVSLFTNSSEQKFFVEVYDELERKELNINQLDLSKVDETAFYSTNYTLIANHTIYDFGKDVFDGKLTENEKFIVLDRITKKMSPPLIINNFNLWLKIYIKNFLNAFNNSKYALIIFILLLFGLIKLRKKPDVEVKIISLGTLLLISNVAIVAIGMHTLKRFIFYNDWIIFLIIFILLDTFTKHKKIT